MSIRRREVIPLVTVLVIAAITTFILLRLNNKISNNNNTNTNVRSVETPEITSEVLVDNLTNPWDVGFIPDGMLVTERGGKLSRFKDGTLRLIVDIENVVERGEGGLMGLAIDPLYAANKFVYVCFNTRSDIRVVRFELNEQESGIKYQQAIITGMPVNMTTFPGRHSGCRPRFGPDGYLWVGTGDVAVGTNPQDTRSLGGKVLRVDRNGQAAPGNLGDPFDPRIYSYGHRNIQGLAFFYDQSNGFAGYSIEHGPGRDDEVNKLLTGNFGWNPVPGYNESVAMTDMKAYPDAIEAVWSSGRSTIAPSGGTILSGSKWKAWDGALAMAVLKDQHVRVLIIDQGKVSKEVTVLSNQFGRIRTTVLGPDQDLYITTDNGSNDKVIRVSPKE